MSLPDQTTVRQARGYKRPNPRAIPQVFPFAHACPWQTVYAGHRAVLDAALVTPAGDTPYYHVDHLGGQCRVRIEPRYSAVAVRALESAFGGEEGGDRG